ncbi:hypothetical protein NQZ79_g834 [Umbelopsis isabellina]|nr:hypothetical protein NQZ79_g834 [Umbelopsis isabellina]
MVRLSLLSICTAAILQSVFAEEVSPPVQIEVQAPWTTSNLGLEILEHVSSHNSSSYFYLLTDLLGLVPKTNNPRQLYEQAFGVIEQKHYLPSDLIAVTKLGLSLRLTAPRVESHHHYYSNVVVPRMNSSQPSFEQCDSWVEFQNQQYCSVKKLKQAMISSKTNEEAQSAQLLPFDHVLSSSVPGIKIATLYGDVMTTAFAELHNFLYEAALADKVTYIVRYKPGARQTDPVALSGYGIELALKNTDYLVIDDRNQDNKEDDSNVKQKVINFGKQIEKNLFGASEKVTMEPLTPTQIKDLGLQAAQFILDSENPLSTLKLLSQDFPKYANSLTDVEINETLRHEISSNQAFGVQPGVNAMWLNGLSIDPDQVDPFSLLKAMKKERLLLKVLNKIGISSSDSIELLSHSVLSAQKGASESSDDVYDVRDDSEEEDIVIWWNDIETDERYSDWPDNLFELLKPTYPGQLRTIRKNIFNILFVMDLSKPKSISSISNAVQDMIQKGYPIRFGLVPKLGSNQKDPESVMSICLHYLTKEFGQTIAIDFLNEVLRVVSSKEESAASFETIRDAFQAVAQDLQFNDDQETSFKSIINGHNRYVEESTEYQKRLGLFANDEQAVFINGKLFLITDDQPWTQFLNMGIGEQMQQVARKLYFGEIDGQTEIYDYLLSQPHVQKRRNPYVIESDTNMLNVMALEKAEDILENLRYTAQDDIVQSANVSVWVISNLDSYEGIKLVVSALENAIADPNVRVSIIHNPNLIADHSSQITHPESGTKFSNIIYQALYESKISIHDLRNTFTSALQPEEHVKLIDQIKAYAAGAPIVEMITGGHIKDWNNLYKKLQDSGLDKHFNGVVVNGRIVGPIPSNYSFDKEDFELLISHEWKKRIHPVITAFQELQEQKEGNLNVSFTPEMVMQLTSVITRADLTEDFTIFVQQRGGRNRVYRKLSGDYCRIESGDVNNATYQFGVILDPASENAQKWSAVLETLSHLEGVHIEIYLNPIPQLSALPLKRFYRYVMDNELHFDEHGEIEHATAYFANLPEDPLYTLGTEEIKSWHISPKVANYDLDNILLKSIDKSQRANGVSAVFELVYILIDGHCRDMSSQGPPRGLQFVLGSNNSPNMTDTIVMANLGYFQLKANPGVWQLSLRDGRSQEIYQLESVGTEGWLSPTVEESGNSIALLTFEGATIYPRVKKYKGKEQEDVLNTGVSSDATSKDENEGTWSFFKNKIFKTKSSSDLSKSDIAHAEINIFSVASGHLYERFLSIMILSVLEHTKSSVKFWFIENFLSPKFKDLIPEMAKEFGFKYEFVTYKWPSWLRSQTERQRTIWGYKILFLDVLFPLNLDKVIFVDADQIVRTDLKELVDMDLQGAPYGYTPFCNDRREMDGFRFWNQGYWKEHLRDRPYHISALYVVDLVRFRQLAAGDRLRAQYQQLSADPHSLANLDQDLPNNMQHEVPIFSLPQEWLWCETWCSDESLKKAKTIDLCNNPLTKEPKLDRARRQVPEWEKYDKEVAAFQKKLSQHTKTTTDSKSEENTQEQESVKDGENTPNQNVPKSDLNPEDLMDVLDAVGDEGPPINQDPSRDEL